MKLKAVFDAIIVEKIEKEENKGSIIIPDMGKEKNIMAKVLSVGPGKRSLLNGELIPTVIKEGDIVILPQIGLTILEDGDDEYLACDEGKVLAIVEK